MLNKKKLSLTVIILVLSVSILIAASFAWFTSVKEASLKFKMAVTAPQSLQISTNSTSDWKDKIDLTSSPIKSFSPISSFNGVKFALPKDVDSLSNSLTGTINKNNVTVLTDADPDFANHVFQQKLYLRSTEEIYGGDINLTVNITGSQDIKILNALRVSVTFDDTQVPANPFTVTYAKAATSGEFAIDVSSDTGPSDKYNISSFTANSTNGVPLPLDELYLDPLTGKELTVNVWFEGNDSECLTENIVKDFQAQIELIFNLNQT